jgi:hypothetical protein
MSKAADTTQKPEIKLNETISKNDIDEEVNSPKTTFKSIKIGDITVNEEESHLNAV